MTDRLLPCAPTDHHAALPLTSTIDRSAERLKEPSALLRSQIHPLTRLQSLDGDVHDSHAMQRNNPVAERLSHAPNLTISSFRKNDAEAASAKTGQGTASRTNTQNHHSLRHAPEKRLVNLPIHLDLVFALMPMFDPQDFIYDIAVVREKNEAGGILIETPDRENPGGMPDFSDDVPPDMQFSGRRHPDRFVILDINGVIVSMNDRAIARHHILG